MKNKQNKQLMSPPRTNRIAYALEFDGPRLRLLRSCRKRKHMDHSLLQEAALPLSQADKNTLACHLLAATQERAPLSCTIPTAETVTRWLDTPFASARKARQVLPSMLDIQLPFPLEKCRYTFPCTNRTDKGFQALGIAALQENILARITTANNLGANPHYLLHEGLPLWHARPEVLKTTKGPVVLVQLSTTSSVLVLGENNRFTGAYPLPGTGGGPEHWVSRALLILRAHPFSEQVPAIWGWVGTATEQAAAIQQLLQPMLNVHFHSISEPATYQLRAINHTVLTKRADPVNFRTGPLTHPAFTSAGKHNKRRNNIILIAANLAILLICLGLSSALGHRERQLDRDIQQLAQLLTGAPMVPRGQELLLVRRALETRQPLLQIAAALRNHPVTDSIAQLITQAAENKITLNNLSCSLTDLSFTGVTPGRQEVERLNAYVMSLGWSTTLTMGTPTASGGTTFSIKGVFYED